MKKTIILVVYIFSVPLCLHASADHELDQDLAFQRDLTYSLIFSQQLAKRNYDETGYFAGLDYSNFWKVLFFIDVKGIRDGIRLADLAEMHSQDIADLVCKDEHEKSTFYHYYATFESLVKQN